MGDTAVEPDETFYVNLSGPTNAVLADAQGLGKILNDDTALRISDVTLTEGNAGTKAATFTVSPETAPGPSAISTFVSLTNPEGVAVDKSGNVYVSTLSVLGDGGIYKFNSAGVLLGFTPMVGKFRLAMDEGNGVLWAQEISGMLYAVNPAHPASDAPGQLEQPLDRHGAGPEHPDREAG